MALTVKIGTKYYRGKIKRRYTVDPRGQQTRTTGEYRVSDNGKITAGIFDGTWADMGLFWNKNRRRTGRGVGGVWKSTSETRFHHSIYNGLMEHEQVQPTIASHVKRYVNFNSDLYGLFEQDYSNSVSTAVFTAKFGATSDDWTGGTIGFNASSKGSESGTASTLTFAHTVQSTTGNRVLLVYVWAEDDAGGPSGVTYAGKAMTVAGAVATDGSVHSLSLWQLANPATGANNVIISGTKVGGTSDTSAIAADFYNVHQTTPLRNYAGDTVASGKSNSEDVTNNSGDNGMVVGGIVVYSNDNTLSGGAGQTDFTLNQSPSGRTLGGGYETGEADKSTAHSYSWTNTAVGLVVTAELVPTNMVSTVPATSVGIRAFDMVAHKGRIFAISTGGIDGATELAYMIRSSTNGTTWLDADNAGGAIFPSTVTNLTTTITRRNNFDDDGARLLDDGDTLWAFIYDYVNGQIECYTSVNATTQGSETWVLEFSIPSADGPKGAVAWFDRTGTQFPLLATAEGLYACNKTTNVFTLEEPFDGQVTNGRWMVQGDDGNLYIPLADDDILQIAFASTQTNGDPTWSTNRIGPMAAHDGMPAEWRGRANYLMSGKSVGGIATQWLWVLFGGHAASTYATILCYDYAASKEQGFPVWHCFHDTQENAITGMGSGNVDMTMMALSAEDDAKVRLHVAAEGTAESIMFSFEEPLVDHVTQAITGKYIADTIVNFAGDDHGDPSTSGASHEGIADAHSLDSTANDNEKIIWYRDNLGVGWAQTAAVGTFYSDALSISLGSGLGVSTKGSNHQLKFTRRAGDSSKKAVLDEFKELYSKKSKKLKGYEIEIDLLASAKVESTITDDDAESVIDNLETVEALETLVAATIGKQAAINIELAILSGGYELVDDGGTEADLDTGRVGNGLMTITIEQRL